MHKAIQEPTGDLDHKQIGFQKIRAQLVTTLVGDLTAGKEPRAKTVSRCLSWNMGESVFAEEHGLQDLFGVMRVGQPL
jgi:hypothetical protein